MKILNRLIVQMFGETCHHPDHDRHDETNASDKHRYSTCEIWLIQAIITTSILTASFSNMIMVINEALP